MSVAVLILNRNGRHHLGPCLRCALSLEGLTSPADVVVADNGSTDGSMDLVQAEFPGVRVLAFETNHGFAAGNNAAAELIDAEYVLFLNNDTRIAAGALERLWAVIGDGVVCAGARLVSWDGRRLDFDGGGAAFTGHGHALGYGRPVPRGAGPERATLFCSGAAMLVHRATFLALGGFDSDYFAYYEDVDLGWRLWLAGYRVLHVPTAVVHHRHHGTADQLPSGAAARHYERNAIATVVKNYEDDLLRRALPAALALAAHRAGADRAVIETADPPPGSWLPLPAPGWAGWRSLEPLGLDFAGLADRRGQVQQLRRRPDGEVLPLLSSPLVPVPPTREGWAALKLAVDHFGLTPVFGPLTGPARSAHRPRQLLRRASAALWRGGPAWLADEIRGYRVWRRGGGG